MPYIRISLMVPRRGREVEVGQLLDQIARACEGQPGFIRGYRLEPGDDSGLIGRVTVWADEHSTDALAMTDHMLALRSALNPAVRKGSHEERGFWAYDTSEPSESSGRTANIELGEEDTLRSAEAIIHDSQTPS